MLYPAYSVGTIIGNALSPFIVERSRHKKHLVVAGAAAALAILILCNAIAARTEVLVAAVFLVTSWATGVTNAVSKVSASEVLSGKVGELRRSDLILTQSAAGALIAIALTLGLVPLTGGDPVAGHVDLLWLGAAAMAAAAVAAVFVGPVHLKSARAARRIHETYREGMVVVRTHQWFRRYAITQLLFVPIALGTTFYSLHAAEQHGDEAGSLHVLVIFTSVGLVTGSVLWRLVYRVAGARGMLLVSALLSSTAAAMCILAQVFAFWSQLWVHGVVYLLTTVANQAIFAAAIAWVNVFAADHHRATLFAFGSMAVAIESVLLGAILGGIAEKASAIWPVSIVLALNVIAVGAALRAPGRASAAASPLERS
ncbi:MFS transporter [Mycolicibacterium sp. S2-37]|uniref:MFS transporter n=1 Tax=Mycolicibacterium sp. S2-37 TaxID=2810297 RepID=UPI001A94F33B|nr:MFS transporter [Mycolicibacterium sp. S2-37]MBO0680501.1 MFS transporter [Mycolicibacterium sp. S2-37]